MCNYFDADERIFFDVVFRHLVRVIEERFQWIETPFVFISPIDHAFIVTYGANVPIRFDVAHLQTPEAAQLTGSVVASCKSDLQVSSHSPPPHAVSMIDAPIAMIAAQHE